MNKPLKEISFKAWHKVEKRWATHDELMSHIPVKSSVREPAVLTVGSDEWELHQITKEESE